VVSRPSGAHRVSLSVESIFPSACAWYTAGGPPVLHTPLSCYLYPNPPCVHAYLYACFASCHCTHRSDDYCIVASSTFTVTYPAFHYTFPRIFPRRSHSIFASSRSPGCLSTREINMVVCGFSSRISHRRRLSASSLRALRKLVLSSFSTRFSGSDSESQ